MKRIRPRLALAAVLLVTAGVAAHPPAAMRITDDVLRHPIPDDWLS